MRLLIVEDNQALLKSLSKGFREEGFTVDNAADGEEGLFLAEHSDYDAVILDLLLPKLDGRELLRALRRGNIQTHILVLTALDAVDETVRVLNSGADDFMTKPFSFAELLARVRALLRLLALHAGEVVSRAMIWEHLYDWQDESVSVRRPLEESTGGGPVRRVDSQPGHQFRGRDRGIDGRFLLAARDPGRTRWHRE